MRKICFLFLLITSFGWAQVQPYQIYNAKGKKVSFEKMTKDLKTADVILFGEFHDNSIIHWLQLKLTQQLHKERPLVLGAEMFERDNAENLTRYVKGEITEKAFDTLVRFWNNYKTDYKPLVEFAKTNKLPFIATNVPRKYASLLYKQGNEALMALPAEEKQFMAPLPFPFDATLPAYAKMMDMFKDKEHANPNFPKAQAIKDATMGYSITQHVQSGTLFLHYNGSYHSDNYEGTYWYIKQYNPSLQVKTISTVQQKNIHKLEKENIKKADYIIVVDEDMHKSF